MKFAYVLCILSIAIFVAEATPVDRMDSLVSSDTSAGRVKRQEIYLPRPLPLYSLMEYPEPALGTALFVLKAVAKLVCRFV